MAQRERPRREGAERNFARQTLVRIAALSLLAAGGCVATQVDGCWGASRQRPSASHAVVARLPSPSNILLLTVDTVRADHLSSYGYRRRTSPVIDRLAAEGVRFDQSAVQWPKTTPSFASMFTSTYSKDNDIVRKVGIAVPCGFEMLAKALKRRGYATRAVVSNGALASEFNFDQGFDTYLETWKLPAHAGPDPNHAEAVTRLAVGLLDGLARDQGARRPWFLWVHYIDPHFPYAPPGRWRDLFQGDRFFDGAMKVPVATDRAKMQMGGIGRDEVLDGHDDLAFYVARYDAAIAYADAEIGELLGEMRRRGLLAHTLTVFTSDHGESLGEHGYYFDHGRFAFQTCLRVPLIFHYPGVLAPRVDAQPVELLDLAPTLLEAAGAELPGGAWKQGRSLTPRLHPAGRDLRGVPHVHPGRAAAATGGSRGRPAGDASGRCRTAIAGRAAAAAGGSRGRRLPAAERSAAAPGAPGALAAQGPDAMTGGPPGRGQGLAFSEAGWETNGKWQKAVRDGRFKLIFAQTYHEQRWIGGEGVRFALFDIAADPLETRNVADRFPAERDRLKRALWLWNLAPKVDVETDPPTPTCGPDRKRDMDPQTRALLHSLGYL